MSQVVIPQSVIAPPAETDLYVVRGDELKFSMGFVGREDIAAAPAQFRLRLVFRRRQSDSSPDLLVAIATLETNTGDTFGNEPVSVMANFSILPVETALLPATGCVFFVEWTDAVGGSNQRVVQGSVTMGD